MQQISNMHAFQIRTKATSCVEVWWTSNFRLLRIGDKKKKKKEEETTGRKYNGLPYSIGGHNDCEMANASLLSVLRL